MSEKCQNPLFLYLFHISDSESTVLKTKHQHDNQATSIFTKSDRLCIYFSSLSNLQHFSHAYF